MAPPHDIPRQQPEGRDASNRYVPLHGILQEFRTALEKEIDAARQEAANKAIPLISGRRIAQVGSGYQYKFDIENVLLLPDGAPGDLLVPGHQPMEATVVSISGLIIIVSVPEDLGLTVPQASLRSDLTFLMRRMIKRIEGLAGIANPAGDRLLGISAPTGGPCPFEDTDLNERQNEAVSSALGRNATFIGGPPGTGKTKTIGSMTEQLYRRQRSVLLVSHTNNAVDQALIHIAKALPDEDLAEGKVLRIGDPHDKAVEGYSNVLLKTHVDSRTATLADKKEQLLDKQKNAAHRIVTLSRQIEICEWLAQAEEDIASMRTEMRLILSCESEIDEMASRCSQMTRESDYWADATKAAQVAQGDLSNLRALKKQLEQVEHVVRSRRQNHRSAATRLLEAQALLQRTTSVGWLSRRWHGLPSPKEQTGLVDALTVAEKEAAASAAKADTILGRVQEEINRISGRLAAFEQQYGGIPDSVLLRADEHERRFAAVRAQHQEMTHKTRLRRQALENLLSARLGALQESRMTSRTGGNAEMMLAVIEEAHIRAAEEVKGMNLQELRTNAQAVRSEIASIQGQVAAIEEAEKKVQETLISEAAVVATTLTRAYLWDAIQSRRFDTVILDEASMAPIPALWVAASLADANAVVVGDPRQLPPIVISNDHLAKKWLGRDVFAVAQPDLIQLTRQYRMHPLISVVPNRLIYDGILTDNLADNGQDVYRLPESEALWRNWYNFEWGHDRPMLLIDTEPLNAWVTSVPRRARRSSRLNFLSATVCVDLAEELLKQDRKPHDGAEGPRIIIVCPYSAHASLLQLLLREQGLSGEVRAGTAHSFQGSEADVVILDLVNDEPHWRVGMFTPDYDENNKRLLNVALTRARRRLFVVGDFQYIEKQGGKAFLGRQVIPLLKAGYPGKSACDVVPSGLAARAAKNQLLTLSPVSRDAEDRLIAAEDRFYDILRDDLSCASELVVIFSPFIATSRLADIAPQIRAAIERKVAVYVITKTLSERDAGASTYRSIERTLTDWGVVTIHKRHMHEKLVLIDNSIVWLGSLNPLSHSNTTEIMERRQNTRIYTEYAERLRLQELVGAYGAGELRCPICDMEIVASEGKDQPYYWLCTNADCRYTRSIDDPVPKGGVFNCRRCGGAFKFGKWGNEPVWRCSRNKRHHQKIRRAHLRLPKMRALIPKGALRKLDEMFSMPNRKGTEPDGPQQTRLF